MGKQWFNEKQDMVDFINHELDELRDTPLMTPDLFYRIIKQVVLYDYTEFFRNDSDKKLEKQAKHLGCKYWSKKALSQVFFLENKDENGYYAKKRENNATKGLQHEHVIPRDILISDLQSMKDNHTPQMIKEYLNRYALACVLTDDEDGQLRKRGMRQKLPHGKTTAFELSDRWIRYIEAGLSDIYECQWVLLPKKGWQLAAIRKILIEEDRV